MYNQGNMHPVRHQHAPRDGTACSLHPTCQYNLPCIIFYKKPADCCALPAGFGTPALPEGGF